MNNLASAIVLLSVPGLPLLLAIPMLRQYSGWPALVALLPAIVLLSIPGSVAVDLPWMLLGDSGSAMDRVSRWWLAMSVVVWAAAASLDYTREPGEPNQDNRMSWLLLSMAGQLGAVLAADLVSFFAFTSLMGYAFFGLLASDASEAVKRAGKIYLVLLILADIILFEALLLVAADATDLGFASLAAALVMSPDAGIALWLALAAFALKTGIWPLQVWISNACSSDRPAMPLWLWIAPVSTGLLGMLRWLSFGEITSAAMVTLLLVAGGASILYAMTRALWRTRREKGIARVVIAAAGAVVLVLGLGLADSRAGSRYADLVPVITVGIGLAITLLICGRVWYRRRQPRSFAATTPASHDPTWYERQATALLKRLWRLGLETLPGLRSTLHDGWRKRWHKPTWQGRLDAGEQYFRNWSYAIFLVLLLTLLTALIGVVFGRS